MPEISQHKSIIAKEQMDIDLVKLEYKEYTLRDGKMTTDKNFKDQCDKATFKKMMSSRIFNIKKQEYNLNDETCGIGLAILGEYSVPPEQQKEPEKKLGIKARGTRGRKKKEDNVESNDYDSLDD
jgi:hypothetical protein